MDNLRHFTLKKKVAWTIKRYLNAIFCNPKYLNKKEAKKFVNLTNFEMHSEKLHPSFIFNHKFCSKLTTCE